jgi:hypothetical protein
MKVTEATLRRIIREELLCERREANISDLVHAQTQQLVRSWSTKLVDDLATRRLPKLQEMDPAEMDRALERLVELITRALGDVFASSGGPTPFIKTYPRQAVPRYGGLG